MDPMQISIDMLIFHVLIDFGKLKRQIVAYGGPKIYKSMNNIQFVIINVNYW